MAVNLVKKKIDARAKSIGFFILPEKMDSNRWICYSFSSSSPICFLSSFIFVVQLQTRTTRKETIRLEKWEASCVTQSTAAVWVKSNIMLKRTIRVWPPFHLREKWDQRRPSLSIYSRLAEVCMFFFAFRVHITLSILCSWLCKFKN